MNKRHMFIFMIVLFLTVGFASITTILNMNGSMAIGTTNFEVKFNRASLNGANRTSLFNINKTAIRLNYTDISSTTESILEYEIVNNSNQYDADVTVSCAAALEDNTEFFYGEDLSSTPVPVRIEAGKYGTGKINIKIKEHEDNSNTDNIGTLYEIVKNQSLGLDKDYAIDYDVSTTSTSDKGVFETNNTDSGKPVYFFRGEINNNNVLFSGKCWNIIRTTETNGVKLIYTGNPVGGTCLPFGTQMGFNLVPKTSWTYRGTDNAYVGYMYGDINSTNYESTHQNKNDSQAKEKVDEWYEKNLKGTKYENYLEDTVWCNDRSLATNLENVYKYETTPVLEQNLGYGSNFTYYASSERSSSLTIKTNPTLKCKNPNDRFTVSKENGNGALKYPVALITTDELVYAGYTGGHPSNTKKNFSNKNFLRYDNQDVYWTMTPETFDDSRKITYIRGGANSFQATNQWEERFIIPMISLNSSIKVLKGDGTKEKPYILETEDINDNSYVCTLEATPISRTSFNDFDLDQLKVGDEYCIGDECFYVISHEDKIVKLLAKYNIYVGKIYTTQVNSYNISKDDPLYGKQNSKAIGYTLTGDYPYYGVVPYSFAGNEYANSVAEKYVNEYASYLSKTYHLRNIKGNLITVEELENLGCDKENKTCNTSWYDWVTGITYWVNTPDPNDTTKTYLVGADGFFGSSAASNINNRGIRPVISINVDIEDVEKDYPIKKPRLYDYIKSLSKGLDTSANINYDSISYTTNGTGVFETKKTDSNNSVYFYRGNVNNNIKFANYCWKILRTTETKGVKLVYNGPEYNNSCNTPIEETIIGKSPYAAIMNDNAYVGYMYGTPNSNNYADTHANIHDSTIKTMVDKWYEENLKGTEAERLIEDTVYCNDRSIETPGVNNTLAAKYGTLGYGSTNNTGYGVVSRMANAAKSTNPTYKCKQENDRFTVNNHIGNGALKYPIGLLNADEVAFAGGTRFRVGSQYSNDKYFLYNKIKFYTMSPNWYDGRIAVGAVNADVEDYYGYFGLELANLEAGVRPVISLKNDVYLFGGDGSSLNPFYIKDLDTLTEEDIPYFWKDDGIFKDYYLDAYKKINSMTLEEKVGQLILAHHSSSASNAINNYHISGFTYFEPDFLGKTEGEVKKMIADEQAASKIPLITAVDEEGGRVVRIASNTSLVSNEMSKYPNLFSTNINNKNAWKLSKDLYRESGNNFTLIEQETRVKSAVLKRLGLNVNFAPVVDMAIEGAYISDRVIGLDARGTAEYGKTVIKTSKETGVSYCLKHFPGYGNNSDTHDTGSVENKTLEELMENDIVPFKESIDNGAEIVMVAHNTVAAIDSNNPASLSKGVHDLLVNELNFTGIITTDALDMGATKDIPDKFVKAIKAGNHLLLVQDYASAQKEIINAVESGTLSEATITRLAFKVLAWKYYKGLM